MKWPAREHTNDTKKRKIFILFFVLCVCFAGRKFPHSLSDVKAEIYNIAVLHDVFLAFEPH